MKTKSVTNDGKFKKYKNKLKSILAKAEKNYYSDQIKRGNNDRKILWKTLKAIISK